jgi:hypothetical protein
MKQNFIQIAIITFLHVKFEMVQPLILSSVIGLISLPDSPIIQVHILNKTLTRPYPSKPAGGLMSLFGGDTATPQETPQEEEKKKKN